MQRSRDDLIRGAGPRARRWVFAGGRIARNALIDLRFGPPLALVYLRDRAQSNSDYHDLELLFDGRIGERDILVDVGCGAGRVVNQWLRMGITNQIYGLENDRWLAAATRLRLRRRRNVIIVDGDAPSTLPPDATFFYLFNPFDESTTRRFAESIVEQVQTANHAVTIVYFNCKHVIAFLEHPEFAVEIRELDADVSAISRRFAVITIP